MRRRLLLAMLPLIQDPDRAICLTHRWRNGPAIQDSDDVPWLLDLARRAASPTTSWTLARLVQGAHRPDQANAILEACADNDVLRRAMPRLCRTVWSGSHQARVAREHLVWRRELDAMGVHPPPVPPPAERIAATLARIEGGDADAFVQLTRDLTLGEDGRYLYADSADLRATPGWQGAAPATRSRIVAAAARYLREGNPEHDRLLEVGEPLDSTIAATHALYLLDMAESEPGQAHPEPDWGRWADVTLHRFMYVGSDERDWAETALRRAYAAAPGVLRQAIRRHLDRDLDRDLETKDWVPTAQGLEPIWDPEIARILLTAAKAARGQASIFRSLFETLLRQGSDQALNYGLQCLGALPEGRTKAERDNAAVVASRLVEHRTAAAWPLVWHTMRRDAEFGRSVAVALADDWRHDEGWWDQLPDPDLGDLSLWMETQFPREGRLKDGRDGWQGSSWDLEHQRDRVLDLLVARGTPAAVAAVGRIAATFPDYPWFRLRLARARESLRRVSWVPPSPAELLDLTSDSDKRLVRDAPELLKLVLESLGRLQERLTGWNGLARALWNEGGKPRPKNENFFSDVVRDHLQRDLKGVAAQREVEVRNLKGKGTGERTDILVTATATDLTRGLDSVAVVIECKGCWNKDLQTAMEDQLKRRYLIDEGHRYGLYLVGWFKCGAWNDKSDRRLAKVPDWTFEEAESRCDAQADDLSDGTCEIRAFVVDACLPLAKTS